MTSLATGITSALVQSLWQDTLIAALLLAAFAVLRDVRARYAAGCAALAAMLVVPLTTGFAGGPSTFLSVSPAPAAIAPAASDPGDRSPGLRHPMPQASVVNQLRTWALPLWCVGVIACSLRLAGSAAYAIRTRRRSTPVTADVAEIASGLAARMGIRRPLAVLVSSRGGGPATVGWLRPIVVVPSAMLGMPPDQFTAILAHELAHIRRHDFLVNLFQLLVETLCFYHPAVWWVSHRIRIEREMCCDDEVVATCGDAIGYARALTFAARNAVGLPAAAVGATGGPLLQRVRRILQLHDGPQASSPWTLAIAAMLMTVVCVAANPRWIHAQGIVTGPRVGTGVVTGTLYDPIGTPAEQVMLIIASSRGSNESVQTRTDDNGRFRFAGLRPGTYRFATPATDFIAPDGVELGAASDARVDVHLAMDETAVNVRVCRDCRESWYKLPPLITGVPGDDRSAKVIARAEPEEGWDAFNQRPLTYPPSLKASKAEGTVELEGVIAADGSTANLQVVSSPEPQLTAAALAILQAQRWHPARVRTTAMQVPLHATVEFTLHGD